MSHPLPAARPAWTPGHVAPPGRRPGGVLAITGVPAVLNTSFNDREPIVETPAHALATVQDCDLDALCIGD